MDISSLTPSERVIEIKHPADNERNLGVRVTLISLNDERMTKLKRRIMDERFRLESKGKHLRAEDVEENGLEICFSAMTGWEWYGKDEDGNDVVYNGTKPDFNRKNVMEVLTKLAWFRNQIQMEIGEETAFFST